MDSIFSQIFKLLVESPGNLVYHLVIVFAALAGLQTVFLLESPLNRRAAARMKTGFVVILAGQVLLFVVSALGWQKIIDAQWVLPLLDRAVILISLIWIGWMMVNPPSTRATDLTVGILTVGTAALFGITLVLWQPFVGRVDFNGSPYDLNWIVLVLLIAVISVIAVIFFRPENWGTDVGFFGLIFAGAVLHMVLPYSGSDYPAAVRLAMISAFPLLPGLSWALKPFATADNKKPLKPAPRSHLFTEPSKVIHSWAKLAGVTDARKICVQLVQVLGQSMDADCCAWINCMDNSGTLVLSCGYDLVKGEPIASRQIPRDSIPGVADALLKEQNLIAPGSDHHFDQDLDTLTFALSISRPVNLLAVPIRNPAALWSGILVFTADPRKIWNDADALNLRTLCEESAGVMTSRVPKPEKTVETNSYQQLYAKSQHDLSAAREEFRLILEELDAMRLNPSPSEPGGMLESVLAVQNASQLTIEKLEKENAALHDVIDQQTKLASESDIHYFEQELHNSLEELAHLQNALAEANVTIMNLQQRRAQPGQPTVENLEKISAAVQKLNGPVSALLTFAEILTTAEGSSLPPAQADMVARIYQSASQMKGLMDDLARTSSQKMSPVELAAGQVAVRPVIDQALAGIAPLLETRQVQVEVNLPDSAPMVYGDRDALQQIVGYLLQNAVNVTPNQGKVHVTAQVTSADQNEPYLIIQVTDEGGGIPAEEAGKLFDREYRAEHPSIPGVGDRGVGLAITRTLVEAHKGRIWVDSAPEGTSTFSVILPVEIQTATGLPPAL